MFTNNNNFVKKLTVFKKWYFIQLTMYSVVELLYCCFVQSALHPHCGMLVSFNAGNYHGVRAVESGQRCAIALWFTRDKRYEDKSAIFARDILTQLGSAAFGPNQKPRHIEL